MGEKFVSEHIKSIGRVRLTKFKPESEKFRCFWCKAFSVILNRTREEFIKSPVKANHVPVIFEKNEEEKYLDPDKRDFDSLYKWITTRYPSDKMKAHPVSRAVNSPENNNKDIISEVRL